MSLINNTNPVIDALNVHVSERNAEKRAQIIPQSLGFGEWPMFRSSDEGRNDFRCASLRGLVRIAHQFVQVRLKVGQKLVAMIAEQS